MAEDEGRRILITGVAGALAGRLAARLEADDRVEHIVGVDLQEPAHQLTRTEFVRADLRNPLVARVLDASRADTVVHLSITASPHRAGGRARMKELNVIGTMQLLAAAQKSSRLRKLVMKSTTAVYGSNYGDPALFREEVAPGGAPRSGYSKDAVEIEGYGRAFGRRRNDVTLSVLRFANFIGADVDSPLTRYLAMPAVPTVLGYDPRLQLVHVDDAVEVLHRATMEEHPGIYNVAGPGIVYLSQALRLAGKPSVPVPMPFVNVIGDMVRRTGRVDFTPEQLQLLMFGRVGSIDRMRAEFGFEPRYSTKAALLDFLQSGRVTPLVRRDTLEQAERQLGDVVKRAGRALAGQG